MATPQESATATAAAVAAGNAEQQQQRSTILIVSHTLTGHLTPMTRVVSALRSRGWDDLFFLAPTAHRARIEASGAVFVPLRDDADLNDQRYYEQPPLGYEAYNALPWHERVLVDFEHQCINTLPTQWACLKAALRDLRSGRRDSRSGSGRKVLVLAEGFFWGALPLRYGAPLGFEEDGETEAEIERPRSICISVTVPTIRSQDLPPYGYPFPFDASPSGREFNACLWERSWARRAAPLLALLNEKMRAAGATKPIDDAIFLEGANYLCHERVLQLGVPGFEYPRSDWPSGFRFAGLVQGAMKGAQQGKQPGFPWWGEIVANSARERDDPLRKKVVVVTQGTVEINPEDLILPTIRAFAATSSPSSPSPSPFPSPSSPSTSSTSTSISSNNVLIIAILGWKNARLLDGKGTEVPVPANARIADYLSYDAALAHADVWLHNGGFGAVCHGIAHGVPMVVAGEGMDKGENARRVAWSGCGVDVGTARPGVAQVRDAVARVLGDGKFRARMDELRKESEGLDSGAVVEEALLGLLG